MGFIKQLKQRRKYRKWLANGRPDPPPPLAKQEMLRDYAKSYGLDVFVETGTFLGDTVEALRRNFRIVHSIELSRKFFELSRRRLEGAPNVELHLGDSSKVLLEIVPKIDGPALFWLDGHYSGGETAKGDSNCPVRAELKAIFAGMKHPFVVMIDDARCFRNPEATDYPSIQEIEGMVGDEKPDMKVAIAMDCIRIVPKHKKH